MPASRTSRYGHVGLRLVLAVVLATAWLSAADAQQPPRLVSAMRINITSLADPGTGLCDVDECTLREAILVANVSPGGDWSKLALNGTITLASELPDITDDLTIDGTDRALRVDGDGAFRVFSATAPITLTTLIVQNGLATNAYGGGAYFGAAAVLDDVTFLDNSATGASLGGGAFFAAPARVTGGLFSGNGGHSGGGAYFQSKAEVSGTVFSSNNALEGAGGGAYFVQPAGVTNTTFIENLGASAGGGAAFGDTSVLTNVSFVGNQSSAGYGGGAVLGGTGSVVTGSLFEGISAQSQGRGQVIADFGAGASVTLTENRIWYNTAESAGGLSLDAGTSASLDNNLMAANTALSPALGSELSVAGANATLTGRHNTLASAAPGSGVALSAGAVGQTVVLTNTIFNGYGVGVAAGAFSPTIQLDGVLWSLVTTPTQGAGITVNNATTGSAAFTNPLLRNYHLTGASAAVDQGLGTDLSVDFEGDPRSSGLAPDLGADEYVGVAQAPPVVNADLASTPEDTAITVNVLANDTDANNVLWLSAPWARPTTARQPLAARSPLPIRRHSTLAARVCSPIA